MARLPFILPVVSRGFAALAPQWASEGKRLTCSVAEALSSALGSPVAIRAVAAPAPPEAVVGVARVLVPLARVGTAAVVEVDAGLLGALLERFAGRATGPRPVLAASDLEQALLGFCVLVAVGAAKPGALEPLAPLVALDDPPPGASPGCVAILLDLEVGNDRGWGRVLVPLEAVEALMARPELSAEASRAAIHASLRDATATITPEELRALSPGDVLLLDPPSASADLVVPGGLTFRGRFTGGVHHVEEIRMTEAQASYPIVLSVEIARVRLTLADLARLAPGVALPLDARKDGAVVLRAGEDVIARGALVDVEGSLGVRIAQIGALP